MKDTIEIPSIPKRVIRVTVRGITPLVSNRKTEAAIQKMEGQQTGQGTALRPPKDIEAEARASRHVVSGDPEIYGHPASAFHDAIVKTHEKGKPYTKKSLELGLRVNQELARLSFREAVARRDMLKNTNGGADLRYRFEYRDWTATFDVTLYENTLTLQRFAAALADAGEKTGIGPQYMRKWFGFGRFEIASLEAAA